ALISHRPRWLAWAALGAGGFGAGLCGALAAAIVRAARSRGLSVSLRDSLFTPRRTQSAAPEVVTFASGVGWRLDADLYRPPREVSSRNQRLASVIVVHGGAWQWGDK